MIAIEKNIPVPTPKHSTGRPSKYPISTMDVNDSFLVTTDNPKRIEALRARVTSALKLNKASGRKFITRKVSENAIRVWRIA